MKSSPDQDKSKGALEPDDPESQGNESMRGQLPHRNQGDLIKGNDTDFPEPGENPEHSGEPEGQDAADERQEAGNLR